MKFSEYPIEIKEKIKQVVKDQGREFNEERVNSNRHSGFIWADTPEGQEFWCQVMISENVDLFFQKYPKKKELFKRGKVKVIKTSNYVDWSKRVSLGTIITISKDEANKLNSGGNIIPENNKYSVNFSAEMLEMVEPASSDFNDNRYYKTIPTNVSKGDSFIVVSNRRLGGSASNHVEIGDVYTLYDNDGSSCPYFLNKNGERCSRDWGYFMPWEKLTPKKDVGFDDLGMTVAEGQKQKAGSQFKVVRDSCIFPVGTIVTLTGQDYSACPYFEGLNKRKASIFWHKLTKINSLNNEQNGESDKSINNSIVISAISATITVGQASGRSIIPGSGAKIQLGD